MKKVFGTIGAVFGFFGLAMAAVFFMETINVNAPAPGTNLTADISANDAQLADVSAAVDPGASDSTATPPEAGVDVPASATIVADTTTAPTPAPAPTPVVPAPVSASEPLPPQLDPTPVTSTVATATITVTPTAPPAPPVSPVADATASTPGALSLPYDETNFTGDNNWQATWGVMKTTWENFIDLSAGPASDGGAIYLKNAGTWENYTMTATLDWVGGSTIGLMADYTDASNYVLCEYSKTGPGVITMQLVQYVNGNEIPLSSAAPVSWSGDGSDLGFSMDVDGIYGSCVFNGQTVSNEGVGAGRVAMNSSGSGGIGFTMRDSSPDTSEIIVRQVEVVEK